MMKWQGVIPAMTTAFDEAYQVDHGFMTRHAQWMVEAGCTGVVALGSLGESPALSLDEKLAILKTCVAAVHVPVVAGIASLSTAEAVTLAKGAVDRGCQGLMVLPPYVYRGDWPEMKVHVSAVIRATSLPCMLYNNPVSYGTDFLPEQIQELADEHENLQAVKESSTDVRRITAIRALIADRLALFVGVDDAIVEGIYAGAVGWIAGLVNAFPKESVDLFNYASAGERDKAESLYHWFLPLLRMDTVPKFVQLIKFVQQEVNMCSARVRPPRLELTDSEREEARRVIRTAIENRVAI